MRTAILLWGARDAAFDRAFTSAFNNYLFFGGGRVCGAGAPERLIVSDSAVDGLAFDVIVLRRGFYPIPKAVQTPQTLFVVQSENAPAVEYLKTVKNNCICYGASQRDSVTFSAVDDERVTVCVQRSLCYRGRRLDIQDFNVRKPPDADAFAAVSGAIVDRLTR